MTQESSRTELDRIAGVRTSVAEVREILMKPGRDAFDSCAGRLTSAMQEMRLIVSGVPGSWTRDPEVRARLQDLQREIRAAMVLAATALRLRVGWAIAGNAREKAAEYDATGSGNAMAAGQSASPGRSVAVIG